MRILLFSNCPIIHGSGSGRTRLAWAGGLRDRGHEVTTVDSIELQNGDEGNPPGRRWRITRGAWRWLTGRDLSRYDLIEFYGAEFALATWRLARGRNRPLLVAHTDGLELLAEERLRPFRTAPEGLKSFAHGLLAGVRSRLETKAFTEVDGFVTASGADVDYLRRQGLRGAAAMEVVPLGLDPAYFDLPWRNPREERVVFLGTWLDRKGIKSVVNVMSALLRERPALKFDIFGVDEAPVEAVLRSFPQEVHDRVSVTPVTSMAAIIAAHLRAKVFFLPSEYEGFGLAIAEAMACGCAVVTTPTGLGAEPRLRARKGACALSVTRRR